MANRHKFFYILVFLSLFVLIYEISKIYKSYNLLDNHSRATDALQQSKIDVLKLILTKNAIEKLKDAKEFKSPIKEKLDIVESWLSENRGEIFTVNSRDILTEYLMLKKCWTKAVAKEYSINHCEKFYNTIVKSLEERRDRERYELEVSIYIGLLALIIFIITSVKVAREYINDTIEQNMIYDNESHLYSYYYCMDIIKKLCSQSDRINKPISAIFIELPSTAKYSLEEKKMVIEGVGEYLTSTVRLSDIACRYKNSSFLILLQNTPSKDKIPVNRISEGLTQHIREFFPDFEVIVSANIRAFEEDCQEFIDRATKVI